MNWTKKKISLIVKPQGNGDRKGQTEQNSWIIYEDGKKRKGNGGWGKKKKNPAVKETVNRAGGGEIKTHSRS